MVGENSFIEKTYVVSTHRNCLYEAYSNVYLQHMLLKIRKTIWKFTLTKYHVHCPFASFKLPKLPISVKMHVALLQIVYICMTALSLNLSS